MASYEIKEVNIDNLKLDPENCRFSYRAKLEQKTNVSDEEIIKYLHNYENLAKLKNQIKNEGWVPPNEPFVIAAPDGKGYIVKEGNRRIAALKTLIQEGIPIKELVDNVISVKLYTDLISLQKAITKIHTEGNEKWDPWAQAMHEQAENIDTMGAHLIGFILRKNIKDILDKPKCYTILIEALASKKTKEELGITFTDSEFKYPNITDNDVMLFIKEIVRAYGKGHGDDEKIDTRTRNRLPNIIEKIKQKIENRKSQEENENIGEGTDLFPGKQPLDPSKPDNSSVSKDTGTKPRRKYPESIQNSDDLSEWLEELCTKYNNKTNGYVSYLLLRDLVDIHKNKPHVGLMLCRSLWDALLIEYYKKPPSTKTKGNKSTEEKSESICQQYTAKLKQEFPDIEGNIAKRAERHIGLFNDVIHGEKYSSIHASLYSTLTDIYPLFSFLVDLINAEKSD